MEAFLGVVAKTHCKNVRVWYVGHYVGNCGLGGGNCGKLFFDTRKMHTLLCGQMVL